MNPMKVRVYVFSRLKPDDPVRVSIYGLPQIFATGPDEDSAVANLMEAYPEKFPYDAEVVRERCSRCPH